MQEPNPKSFPWRMYVRRYGSFILIFLVLLAIGFATLRIGPEAIIDTLGVTNSYLVLFVLGLVGGVSTFTSSSFYAAVLAFGSGGLSPLFIGLIGGMGMSIGDSAFFLLGVRARRAFFSKQHKYIHKIYVWLSRRPRWVVPIFIYIYTGFTPFPGDALMIVLALLEYPYRKIIIPTILGNITLLTWLSFAAQKGVSLLGS